MNPIDENPLGAIFAHLNAVRILKLDSPTAPSEVIALHLAFARIHLAKAKEALAEVEKMLVTRERELAVTTPGGFKETIKPPNAPLETLPKEWPPVGEDIDLTVEVEP